MPAARVDEFTDPSSAFGGPNSILGRSDVHGDASGAGVRVAMCVIGVAQESTTTDETGSDNSPTRTTRSVGAVAMTARVAGVRTSATSGTWVKGADFTGDFGGDTGGSSARQPNRLASSRACSYSITLAMLFCPQGAQLPSTNRSMGPGNQLRLRYTVNWAVGAIPTTSGIHIHEGESCDNPGPHFWNQDEVGATDPWTTITWDQAVRRADPNSNQRASMGTTDVVYAGVSSSRIVISSSFK